MGDQPNENTQEPPVGVVSEPPVGDTQTGINPAWNDLLNEIPSSLHHVVTPHLTKWDQGIQQKFQQIQQDTSVYEPYKDFVDNKVDPQSIQQALAVMGMLNDKPEQFFQEMQNFYSDDPRFKGILKPEGQGQQEFDLGEDQQKQQQQYNLESDPRFQQLTQQQEIIANFLSTQVQQQEQAKEDAALDAELTAMTQKFGEFDEDYVLGLVSSGIDLDKAVQRYKNIEAKFRQAPLPGSNLPPVVNPGGGVPSTAINPADLSSQDTKNLIASYLASQAQER
jgi:hypothetical protein